MKFIVLAFLALTAAAVPVSWEESEADDGSWWGNTELAKAEGWRKPKPKHHAHHHKSSASAEAPAPSAADPCEDEPEPTEVNSASPAATHASTHVSEASSSAAPANTPEVAAHHSHSATHSSATSAPSSSSTSESSSPTSSPSSSSSGAVQSSPSSSTVAPTDFQNSILDPHNTLRASKGAPKLTWDASLASYAETWAKKCDFLHSGGPHGENLASASGTPTNAALIKMWSDEESEYSSSNPQPSHYTQMVWKGTTKIGCFVATCAPGTIFDAKYGSSAFMVCEYDAPGNVIGAFGQNVEA